MQGKELEGFQENRARALRHAIGQETTAKDAMRQRMGQSTWVPVASGGEGGDHLVFVDPQFLKGMKAVRGTLVRDLWQTGESGQQYAIEIVKEAQKRVR